MPNHFGGLLTVDTQVLQQPCRCPDLDEGIGDGLGTGGHVRVMLHQAGVAGHDRRRTETKSEPERRVPGQDPQHRPQWQMLHITAAGIRGQFHIGQVLGTMVGIVLGAPGGLLYFAACLDDRFAHLHGHQAGQALLVIAHEFCHLAQQLGPLHEAGLAPCGEGVCRLFDDAGHFLGVVQRIPMQFFAGGRVGRYEHKAPYCISAWLSVSCLAFFAFAGWNSLTLLSAGVAGLTVKSRSTSSKNEPQPSSVM